MRRRAFSKGPLILGETWGKNCYKQAQDVASTNISIPLSIPCYISKTCPPNSPEQGHFHHYVLSYSLQRAIGIAIVHLFMIQNAFFPTVNR